MKSELLSRREMLGRAAWAAAALTGSASFAPALATRKPPRFQIGACDWSLGKMADVAAFELAGKIGLDGVQVSLGTVENDMHLRRPEVQRAYREAAAQTGVAIASLALGELNRVPYKSDPRAEVWVRDAIDVARALGVRVILLAFFSAGDLRGDPAGVDEVVRRLRAVAPKAEKAGVILGLESWLSAAEHLEILRRVGSKAVQVYYDVCNATDRSYDIFAELRALGRRRICELHAKETGALLGRGKVDYARVRTVLDEIGYRGWVQIEGAIPPGGTVLESSRANLQFLRGILNA